MGAKPPLWIEHNHAMRLTPKHHHPMPKSSTTLHAPFDRKKCEIRQCLPGVKRPFFIRGTNAIMTEKRADVGGIRPEPIILSRNAELVSRALRVPVCHPGKRGHACDTASGGFLLEHWFHRIKHDELRTAAIGLNLRGQLPYLFCNSVQTSGRRHSAEQDTAVSILVLVNFPRTKKGSVRRAGTVSGFTSADDEPDGSALPGWRRWRLARLLWSRKL
jgi:hypothetical protein